MKDDKFCLKKIIGGGYEDFWFFKGRYRVVKGGRASKKSKTAALWYISNMMRFPEANLLVVRKTYRTLRNSCFAELKWAVERLNASPSWKVTSEPMEMRLNGGGKICFRGLDNPQKLTSVTAERGSLCWIWIEEAFEINSEADFDMLDETIRGKIGGGLFKQVTLTLNPWNEKHWIKKRFFDAPGENVLALTTDYTCNEWLDETDYKLFERMRELNPKRYVVAGLGEWGICEGLVFENWEVREFNRDVIRKENNAKSAFGLDFGYANDPSALCCMLVDTQNGFIHIFDEIYEYGASNKALFEKIHAHGYAEEKIFADSAEPKSIDELYALGLKNIRKARKGPDSVNHGIQFAQGFKIVVAPKCANFIREIGSYSWEVDAAGNMLNKPVKGSDHLIDAMRYGLSEISAGERWGF